VVSTVAPLAIVVFGLVAASGSVMSLNLQTRLMDVAGEAQNLAASMNHSALNLANAGGAAVGGMVINAGFSYSAPALAGVGMALCGIAVFIPTYLMRRRSMARQLVWFPMSLTVATVNVNGIRAAAKVRNENNHGILPWLESTPAEIVLLQEVRANPEQTAKALAPALESGWQLVQAEAAAKGRAGVAILSRHEHRPTSPSVSAMRTFSGEFDGRRTLHRGHHRRCPRGQRVPAVRCGGHGEAGREVPFPRHLRPLPGEAGGGARRYRRHGRGRGLEHLPPSCRT
jgi:hypothetical protein